ncbi:hypothetical protein NMG60_11033868 [Bertholletia excelsa]
MQSILNLHSSYGLPLCLSGITHPLSLSKEMADHDRRREAMRKQKGEATEGLNANLNQELGFGRNTEGIREGAADGDLHDQSYVGLVCTAKAA